MQRSLTIKMQIGILSDEQVLRGKKERRSGEDREIIAKRRKSITNTSDAPNGVFN